MTLISLCSFIIDSLDSLLIMDLKEDYDKARDWVANLSFDLDGACIVHPPLRVLPAPWS